MPKPPSPVSIISRTYLLPPSIIEWLGAYHKLYKMRDGRYAKSRIDVVRDALEVIRADERAYAISPRVLPSIEIHPPRSGGEATGFKLPEPLVKWVEEYHRFHRMLDGTRAGSYTDLIVDALARAKKRSRK